jgi:acetyl-CoA carboxylase biotin carboxylase subunit
MAKKTVKGLGITVVPGSEGPIENYHEAAKLAQEMRYPILIKASTGGGGKGMKVANNENELAEALDIARFEAKANFGNDAVFLEKYLAEPRHIEIQVIADHHGNAVHLGERDCSIQRRHQKLWEEAPSPSISERERKKLGDLVCRAVTKLGYRGVGTFEFLYEKGQFYFIEMNTRLQVEHPITEMITGIDLVQEQIKIAQEEKLSFDQNDITFSGHAIECRVNAEHPDTFAPSPGKVTDYHAPGGINVRIDSALYAGYTIPTHYDSLVAKLIVYGNNRVECLSRLRRALDEYVINGIQTTLPLHRRLSEHQEIIDGKYTIHWLEKMLNS